MSHRFHLLRQLAASLALALCGIAPTFGAPVCVDPGGVGGTGAPRREGGIGGTGAPASGIGGTGAPAATGIGGIGAPLASGIGGTGAPLAQGGVGGTGAPAHEGGTGGTGIVGTITGFASICVNGVEVHYDDSVPVTENGIGGSVSRLAVGQVVAVEAGSSPRGLEARTIAIVHAYEGPVTGALNGRAPLRVMGQPVRLVQGAKVDAGLHVGEMVRVSGFRNASGEVLATRVERAPQLREASAIGSLGRDGTLHGLALGGHRRGDGGDATESLIRGAWTGSALAVSRTSANPTIPFAGRVRNAIVEGLVLERADRHMDITGFEVELADGTDFSDSTTGAPDKDARVRVQGTFTGERKIRATRIEFVRDGFGVTEAGEGARSGRKSDKGDDDKEHGGRKARVESDDKRIRIETDSASGRERIERELSPSGEIERERIERTEVSPSGDLLLRERIETRTSGDRIETRERIERFDGSGRVERTERIERPDRVERIERPEKLERPERIERPEHD
ncbi:DUF5666 domain-containing protein [Aromatoleum petrolei]|uniref:DUF5666 domain-containing protein n=1 Tax=Aromatoleum petrolei TaxID=76116 RepID=A0ABX1MJF5_9RHOO|nr:DUF5666 domain-containing protein [Aromatoleum petrolei]NMF87280.1 hypothetical protein [Aromatoleum petrolei]QTQ38525.1 Uncharacterized protein ToN1_44270 [Aromatoleum petrolei]